MMMMNNHSVTLFLIVAAAAVATTTHTTTAFVPSSMSTRQPKSLSSMVLSSTRADSADLIKEAMEISKQFGITSPEAKLAWEAVEEVDAADNSEATKGSLDNCDVDSLEDEACEGYAVKLAELEQLLAQTKPTLTALQTKAAEVSKVKLPVPVSTDSENKISEASSALVDALEEAKQITAEQGISSNAAKVAWESVEEIASAKSQSNALGGSMSPEECLLVDAAMEACEAMEELNRALRLNNNNNKSD